MLMSTQGPGAVLTVAILLPLLDTIAVGLRFLARKRQGHSIQTDDWLTIPALVSTLFHQLGCLGTADIAFQVLIWGLATILIVGVGYRAFGYPTPSLQARTSLEEVGFTIVMVQKVCFLTELMIRICHINIASARMVLPLGLYTGNRPRQTQHPIFLSPYFRSREEKFDQSPQCPGTFPYCNRHTLDQRLLFWLLLRMQGSLCCVVDIGCQFDRTLCRHAHHDLQPVYFRIYM
jgi:hypothetical protein